MLTKFDKIRQLKGEQNVKDLMSRDEALYYIERFKFLIRSDTTIAKKLEISYATWLRWMNGENSPPLSMRPEFKDLLTEELKTLHNKAKRKRVRFLGDVADAIIGEEPPEHTKSHKPADNPQVLRDLLTELCYGRTATSTDIFRKALELGYTKLQIYHVADKLGIVRNHVKKGRGGYSNWSMRRRR